MPIVLVPIGIGVYELGLLAAGLVAATWFASPQGQQAGRSAGRALSEALTAPRAVPVPLAPAVPRTCPRDRCDDKCGPLLAQIQELMAEIRGRIAALEIDQYGLHAIRPQKIRGIGSWPGHIQQLENKQAQLRGLLLDAGNLGCPIPPGAWQLATRNPPNRPHRQDEATR